MRLAICFSLLSIVTLSACSKDSSDDKKNVMMAESAAIGVNALENAERASIDRFSESAGHLHIRTATNGLPAANFAVDFDKAPFITTGLTEDGRSVQYYNFDVQATEPAPIYVLFFEGASSPVPGQINIINAIPGEAGYNDFWRVIKVTVPASYVANSVKSFDDIVAGNYVLTPTDMIVNCPVVPEGSTATKRLNGESPELSKGWYRNKLVFYFNFGAPLKPTATGKVPTSPIYVTFNINPGQESGGPSSGFKTEPNKLQTHNVIATIPGDTSYSPLWAVSVYDNGSFDSVKDLDTVLDAEILAPHVADVNCPVVEIAAK